MRYDPDKYHRQSTRLRCYDYSQAGGYFVTICVQGGQAVFGSACEGQICLSNTGVLAQSAWTQLTDRFPSVLLDEFVLMPNHLHGIIFLPPRQSPDDKAPGLGEIIRTLKAVTTRLVRQSGQSNFVWQRNYFEHIILDEQDLFRIRRYIANNPAFWADDAENPDGHMA